MGLPKPGEFLIQFLHVLWRWVLVIRAKEAQDGTGDVLQPLKGAGPSGLGARLLPG